jgi:alkylglycerol monooxygenase
MDEINLIALAIPVFFTLMIVEMGVARRQGLAGYRLSDGITDISCGMMQQATSVFVKVIPIAVYVWVYENMRITEISGVAAWIVAFLGTDMMYYWWHRFSHRVNIGWATHVVHHQSEDYNLAVALRQSLTSSITLFPFYLPLALIGIHPLTFAVVDALITLYQFWIHTETIDRMGAFGWVFNTPSHHRVHHGINPEYLDKNYAGALIIWDRMFGTFEKESRQPVYGTVKPLGSFNPLWANVWYFWLLYKDSAAAQTSWERWKVWWSAPGYRPEGLAPYPVARQMTRSEQHKYDPEIPPGLSRYVFGHFLPMSVWIFCVLWYENTAGTVSLGVGVAMIVWTAVAWGGLFERKSWAFAVETGRVAAIGMFITYLFSGDAGWVGLIVATWIGAVISVGWIASYREVLVEA